MVKKVVIIEGKERGLDEVTGQVEKLNTSIEKVEGSSKETDGALKKVADNGGAISTLDAFTGGLATRIRDAAEATKVFNFNLKGTKTALIATGVGAFVVVLGLIVAYWEDIVDLITGANSSLEDQVNLYETKVSVIEAELELLDQQLDIYSKQGKEVGEILDRKKELLELQVQDLRIQKLILEEQLAQEQSDARRQTFLENLLGRSAQLTAEEQEGLSQLERQVLQTELAILKAEQALDSLLNPTSDTTRKTGRPQQRDRAEEAEATALPITGLQSLEELNTLVNEETRILSEAQAARTLKEREEAEARVRARIFEVEAKDDLLQAEAGLLQQFSGFLSVFGEENKALAIASIVAEEIAGTAQIISATGVANAKAVAASPLTGGQPWVGINTASAILSRATSAAAAAKAISKLGGGGSLSSFAPTSSTQAPAFNVVGSTDSNQIVQSIQGLNDTPVQAFVVDKEVTSSQELRRNKKAASSF